MTSKHLDKHEVRKTDALTSELKKGFVWTATHMKIVMGAIVLFLVIGGGYSFLQYSQQQKEDKASAEFSKIEKDYLKKREAFERFEASSAQKNQKAKDQLLPQGEKASGDLEKDYGQVLQSLQKIIDQHSGTHSAVLAAMTANEIYLKYEKPELALQVANKIKPKNDLVSSLLLSQKGIIQANLNDCKSAIQTWDQVLKNKKVEFIHSELLLKQAFCYETLNEPKKAEDSLSKIIAQSKDGTMMKTAEKYLRAIRSQLK